MRQRPEPTQSRKLSLIRPSSGYYGYTKRTDSDTDLGRFSSNNVSNMKFILLSLHKSHFLRFFTIHFRSQSLSSGSSKSSLSRGETPESFATPLDVNATFVQSSVKTTSNVPSRSVTANGGSGMAPPRMSLLRQPNPVRRSALPRPAASTAKR